MSEYGLMGGAERPFQDLMDAVGHGAWWSSKKRDPYADIPTLHYDVPDYRKGPQIDPAALMMQWRASMPGATLGSGAGRVPQFAAPSAMTPPMNRQSANMREPTDVDFVIGALFEKGMLPFRALIGASKKFGVATGMTPPISMQEIGYLLPKQDIPFMGPRR